MWTRTNWLGSWSLVVMLLAGAASRAATQGTETCFTTITFDGNEVPLPWVVLDRDGNTGETTPTTTANERLEANPVNRGQRIEGPIALPPGASGLVIEFDALAVSSAFGAYAEIKLYGPVALHDVLERTSLLAPGPDLMELWTAGPSGRQPAAIVPVTYGPHHHRMVVRDEVVERRVWNLDTGALVADVVQDLPGFVLADLEWLVWEVYVTTDNGTWGDNFMLRCETTCDCEGVLAAAVDAAGIDVQGVARSLDIKAIHACRLLALGKTKTSGNVFCALLDEIDAQAGRHLPEAGAGALRAAVLAQAAACGALSVDDCGDHAP